MSVIVDAIVVGLVLIAAIICFTIYCLKKLARECKHQWNTVEDFNLKLNGRVIGVRYIQRCVHCGKIQHVDCRSES